MSERFKPLPRESVPGNSHTLRHNEYGVDVYKLIALSKELPTFQIVVEAYLSQLDDPCWTDDAGNAITPRLVVDLYRTQGADTASTEHPELSKHLRQIAEADYSQPVIVFESKVIDGTHRLAKASVDGVATIPAKILSGIPTEAVMEMHLPADKQKESLGVEDQPKYTLEDLKQAREQDDNWMGPNNPGAARRDSLYRNRRIEAIETYLKETGALEYSESEKITMELDKLHPNAASRTIVEYKGKKYRLRYLPQETSNSGKTVYKWQHSWDEYYPPKPK